jgi:hypothetical protein
MRRGTRGRQVRQLPRAQGVTVCSPVCSTCKIVLVSGYYFNCGIYFVMLDVTGIEPDVTIGSEPFSGQCSTDQWENCLAVRWR